MFFSPASSLMSTYQMMIRTSIIKGQTWKWSSFCRSEFLFGTIAYLYKNKLYSCLYNFCMKSFFLKRNRQCLFWKVIITHMLKKHSCLKRKLCKTVATWEQQKGISQEQLINISLRYFTLQFTHFTAIFKAINIIEGPSKHLFACHLAFSNIHKKCPGLEIPMVPRFKLLRDKMQIFSCWRLVIPEGSSPA